jgi:hypothetical protein
MSKRKSAAPSVLSDSPSITWCRLVSAACLDFDWSQIAADTIQDPRIAAVVAKGLQSLGRYIDGEIKRAEDAAAAPPPMPVQSADEADDVDDADARGPDEQPPPIADSPADDPPPVIDERAAAAAALLGVAIDATEDEIRSALRSRLASSRLHPDHGGDGEQAKNLIAAKNLLIERARAART